jgi:Rrf2 family protein
MRKETTMLSQTCEHALRAVLFLAQQPAGTAVPAERVAAALGAPANYLGKTLNLLARRGLLASARGPAGGFRLLRRPAEIAVGDVMAAVEERPRSSAVCLLGNRPCLAERPCAAHARWAATQAAAALPLHRTTVADLLGHATDARPGDGRTSAVIPQAGNAA